MVKKLAIVIPAYKIDFFEEVLISLVKQTNRDFRVYIGIDASPHNFESIIAKYVDKIDIKTTRFDQNLGGKNLVAQWERCIAETMGEEYIWLFSDDDLLGSRCVEMFFQAIEANNDFDIYHFDVKVVDSKSNVIKNPRQYPDVIDAKTLFRLKSRGKIESFVVENIFNRRVYEKLGGFVNFPMAWGSDTATWIAMSGSKGMMTIKNDYVYWRSSDVNITPDNNSSVIYKKLMADIDYLQWVSNYFGNSMRLSVTYAFILTLFFDLSYIDKVQYVKGLEYSESKGIIGRLTRSILVCTYPLMRTVRKFIS